MDLRSRSCGEGHAREGAREVSAADSVCSLVRTTYDGLRDRLVEGVLSGIPLEVVMQGSASSSTGHAPREQERTVSTLTPAMLDLVPPPGVLPIRPSSGLGDGWREGALDELAVWAGGTASDGWVNESVASSSSS